MLCPLCARGMKPVEREGVEIDYCPQCGGIWLDQGELNQLIRREAMDAIQRGQDALLAARRDREYDHSLAVNAGTITTAPVFASSDLALSTGR